MSRRDVFQAIADPNRRAILGLLASENLTLNGIADKFKISRPAVSKHVKILKECGLVEINQKGRERYAIARLEKLTWFLTGLNNTENTGRINSMHLKIT